MTRHPGRNRLVPTLNRVQPPQLVYALTTRVFVRVKTRVVREGGVGLRASSQNCFLGSPSYCIQTSEHVPRERREGARKRLEGGREGGRERCVVQSCGRRSDGERGVAFCGDGETSGGVIGLLRQSLFL